MQGSQLEGGDTVPHPIGKKELLLWAGEVSGTQCSKFEDLRDGVVIMRVFPSIWPRCVDPRNSRKMKAAPQLEWELKRNWDTIKSVMTDIRLPVQLVDVAAIQQGASERATPARPALLHDESDQAPRVQRRFRPPIDPRLSVFLQSNASIDALSRGGALSLQPSDSDDGDDGANGAATASSQGAVTALPHDTPADSRSAMSPSPSAHTPLVSLLGFSNDTRSSRSQQQSSALSLASTHTGTSSNASDTQATNAQATAASQRTDDRFAPAAIQPPPQLTPSSSSEPRVFTALEQTTIESPDDSSSFQSAHGSDVSAAAPSSRADGGKSDASSRIHLTNSMSVSANLVSSTFVPDPEPLAPHSSRASSAVSPAVASYSGVYTATPQSARGMSLAFQSASTSMWDRHDADVRDRESSHGSPHVPPNAAPAAVSNSQRVDQLNHSNLTRLHHVPVQNPSVLSSAEVSVTSGSHTELPTVGLTWKSSALQDLGEAAIAQLKVENESLHRQLQLQREETAAQQARHELQLDQLRQQTVLEAAVFRSRIEGLEAQMSSSTAAQEARLRREFALSSSNLSDQMRLVKVLGSSAVQREFGDVGLEEVVLTLKQQQLQLQGQVAQLQRSVSADSAALAAAESSVEVERKRVRDLETKVAAATALPTAAPSVAKLINAVVVEHPGGGALSLRERRLVSIIEAMELEITEMHIASDCMIEAFNSSQIKSSSPGGKPKSALDAYEEQREVLVMSDKLVRAEERERYLTAQVAELTRILDLERLGAGIQRDSGQFRQESPHKPGAATPFAWLSQAPGPGEQERLSRNSAVVKALETAISCIPDSQSEMSSLKAQLNVALSSFWQMEVESLLLRRRLFQTSALIEASAERLHSREKLLSEELTACRERHDETVKQLGESHLNQCLQLSKQSALFQVQCEIKDIVAQELKLERDAAFADLKISQTAACCSSIGAFKTMHARLLAVSQEAARFEMQCALLSCIWVTRFQAQTQGSALGALDSGAERGDIPLRAPVIQRGACQRQRRRHEIKTSEITYAASGFNVVFSDTAPPASSDFRASSIDPSEPNQRHKRKPATGSTPGLGRRRSHCCRGHKHYFCNAGRRSGVAGKSQRFARREAAAHRKGIPSRRAPHALLVTLAAGSTGLLPV
jgi:hypothetical protein